MTRKLTRYGLLVVVVVATAGVGYAVAGGEQPARTTPEPTETPTETETETPPGTANDQLYPRGHECAGQHYPQEECPPLTPPGNHSTPA